MKIKVTSQELTVNYVSSYHLGLNDYSSTEADVLELYHQIIYYYSFVKTWSGHVVPAGCELAVILQPLPPKCWDQRSVPPLDFRDHEHLFLRISLIQHYSVSSLKFNTEKSLGVCKWKRQEASAGLGRASGIHTLSPEQGPGGSSETASDFSTRIQMACWGHHRSARPVGFWTHLTSPAGAQATDFKRTQPCW